LTAERTPIGMVGRVPRSDRESGLRVARVLEALQNDVDAFRRP